MATLNVFSASAGSGKTYTLARKVIDLLVRDPQSYAHLLAVTFTNKATGEMKERIVGDLHILATEGEQDEAKRKELTEFHMRSTGMDAATLRSRCATALRNILYDYDHLAVSTIDKFVQRLLRSFAYEQGLPANYGVQLDQSDTVNSAFDDMMEAMTTDTALRDSIVAMAQDNMEANKKWTVDADIKALGSLLLTDDAEYLQDEENLTPEKLKGLQKLLTDIRQKALTTTYEAATDLKNAIERTGVTNLNKTSFKKYDRLITEMPPSADTSTADLRRNMRAWGEEMMEVLAGLASKKITTKQTKGDAEQFITALTDISTQMGETAVRYNTVCTVLKNVKTMSVMSHLAWHIAEVERRDNTKNIGSSGAMLKELIDDCPVPFIYEKSGARYDTIMIDEFQDTSRVQYENFAPLLRNSLDEGNDCLIVGDVKQSIYRFRGGDWRLLGRQVERDFAQYRHEALRENYRSRNEIVQLNNLIFGITPKVMDDTMSQMGENIDTTDTMEAMYAECQQEPKRGNGGMAQLEVVNAGDAKGAAMQCAKEYVDRQYVAAIRELHDERGFAYADICVLVRANNDGKKVIARLSEEGIPFMSDDSLLVMSSDATQCVTDAMRYISTGEPAPLFSAVKTLTGLDVTTVSQEWQTAQSLWAERLDGLRGLSLVEMAGELVNMLPEAMRDAESPFLDAFLQNMNDAIRDGTATLDAFLLLVDANAGKWVVSATSGADAVRIMTIHKSKGLEFNVVIIPFANWRIVMTQRNGQSAPVIWCDAAKLGLPDKTWQGRKLPVPFTQKLLNTAFAQDYTAEARARMEDALNLAYVAMTRPREILLAWSISSKTDKNDGLGDMGNYLSATVANMPQEGAVVETETLAFDEEEDDAETEEDEGKGSNEGKKKAAKLPPTVTRIKFGVLPKAAQKRDDGGHGHIDIPIAHAYCPSASPAINTEVEMGEYERTDMISYGLTMHGIFERVTTMADLHPAIERAVTDGLVLPADASKLEAEMSKKMKARGVSEWFDGTMTDVWAETTMVGPDRRLRPDRIMTSGGGERTVIVDYKFGRTERAEHRRQVEQYVEWLTAAGFRGVEAYLWYYTLNKVVRVGQ